MSLAARDERLLEVMDDPNCDPVRLHRTLRRFWAVNGAVSRWGRVYRNHVRPALARSTGPVRILDIGCGGGDVLRRLVRLARRDGFAVEGVGIDPDPRAWAAASSGAPVDGVSFRAAASGELVAAGERFDAVVSNHLLHHLDAVSLEAVLADSQTLATRVCVHSDIARSRLAYAAFAVCAAPIAPGTFLRVDGLRSIRRSYTRDELAARLPRGWLAEQPAAFRLLAVHRTWRFGVRPDEEAPA
ncbi:methyltransferase domain-containing protein [Leucobacter triazinivorans]|uniref:Methyltransferase domain-containing protein n=2 Tax=Leucobacter triazinivorans TaxID=1784719 RepID=A0A4P6KIP5_9MICO|nr:methyltransferase domain-containing protein [Leucobacter triazinivorans]